MKKTYSFESFLEKKLQEIEQVQAQNEDIEPRIEFLKNLVSAEVSHHSSDSIPPHLRDISQQLTRLESGYLKGKEYETAKKTLINDDDNDNDKCDHQEENDDSVPGLETVEAKPVIVEKMVSNEEGGEKSGGLKRDCCCCLVMIMSSGLFFVMGAALMLSFCGCSGYYYHNSITLQYAPGFSTPT